MTFPNRGALTRTSAAIGGGTALLLSLSMAAGAASPAVAPAASSAPSPIASGAPLASPMTSAAPSVGPSSVPASPAAVLAVLPTTTTGTIEATGGTWSIDVPTLTGPLDPAVLAAVNEALAAGAAADLAAFQAGSTVPPAGFDGTDGFASTFTVPLLTGDLLSLKVLNSMYAAGAAHPIANLEPSTFDLTTGARVALADLFKPDAKYLPALSKAARHQLRTQLGHDKATRRDIRLGTKPRAGNFSGWAMTPAGLQVTFSEYAVGPYAIGMPEVLIPWAQLRGLLDPAGPAAPFLGTDVAPSSPGPSASPSPTSSPSSSASPAA